MASAPSKSANLLCTGDILAGAAIPSRSNPQDLLANFLGASDFFCGITFSLGGIFGRFELFEAQSCGAAHRIVSLLRFGYRSGTQVGICNLTWDYPQLVSFINLCLRQAFPGKSWASICVSHNSFAKLRSDSGNLYGSENHALSLGQHVGGLLWLESALDQPAPPPSSQSVDCSGGLVNIHEKPFSFNPRLLHGSSEWVGDRWVLIPYTPTIFQSASSEDLLQLQALSFPLPGAASESVVATIPSPVPLTSDTKLFLDLCCGSSAPCSTAVRALGIPCLAVDPLFGEGLDLLHDETFDRIMALAHNGVFKFAHGSPPCGEFSLVKLRS